MSFQRFRMCANEGFPVSHAAFLAGSGAVRFFPGVKG